MIGSRMRVGMFTGLIEVDTQELQEIHVFPFIRGERLVFLEMVN